MEDVDCVFFIISDIFLFRSKSCRKKNGCRVQALTKTVGLEFNNAGSDNAESSEILYGVGNPMLLSRNVSDQSQRDNDSQNQDRVRLNASCLRNTQS